MEKPWFTVLLYRPSANRSKACFKSSPKSYSRTESLRLSVVISHGENISGTRTAAVMQRSFLSRGALLAQQTAAALEGRSAPILQRMDRSMSSVSIPPPACILRPLEVPLRYLFGPGPSNVPPRVLVYLQAIVKHKPVLFFLTHGESSAGLCHPIDGIGDICQKHNCLFLVDTVASLGAAPIFMDSQNIIDILYTGSQKALNAPPGTAPISFNDRACHKMFNRKTKPVSYLFDMTHLANYWGCDGKPARVYHHTGPVSGFFALRESLSILAERGLEESWKKHKELAAYLYRGLEDLGLKLFIPDKDLRLPSVTTIAIPEGYDWRELLAFMMKNHNMEMTGGLGPSIGMVMRIGLMGYNCEKRNADMALHALEDALKNFTCFAETSPSGFHAANTTVNVTLPPPSG